MRVTITHRQEDGLLPSKKLYFVDCAVLFSEEEKAIIQERGLGRHYIEADSEMPPPATAHRTASTLLKALAPLLLLGGCVTGCGMAISGNEPGGDTVGGLSLFAAVAMFLAGVALKRHVRIADRPKQTISLSRLLGNPKFTVFALDNARAKLVDEELRTTLARLKDGLLVNRDITQPDSFEL